MNATIQKTILLTSFAIIFFSCGNIKNGFTKQEIEIIKQDSSKIMKIYTVDSPNDLPILRKISTDISTKEINRDLYKTLSYKMLKTVTDKNVDGVGIAAPQVGINRRIIAVQRLDKPGHPFEVFPNIYIQEYSPKKIIGSEGCLSVPDKSGKVERAKWIIIKYTNPNTLSTQQDTIKGFTAIIFQHEIDHLEGIVYTDKLLNNPL